MGTYIATLRHLFSQRFASSSRSHHSGFPHHNPRPYSTRIEYPQLQNTSSLESCEDIKSLAISTTSSISSLSSPDLRPLSSMPIDVEDQRSRADSYQKDLFLMPETEPDPALPQMIVESTLPPTLPSKVVHPLLSVRPVEAEKDNESAHQWSEHSSQQQYGWHREKVTSSWPRRFYVHWFTAYRILIALTIVINVVILGLLIGLRGSTGSALTATAANLMITILVRQEDLINITFGLVSRIPSTLPLALRKTIADLHHYGGVHVGTATSALVWYIVFVAMNTRQGILAHKDGTMTAFHWVDIITCYAFLLALVAICITAIPRLRQVFHDTFECTHRFAGWTALVVLWINSGIHTRIAPSEAPSLERQPALWLLAAVTFFIILPWLRIRRIPITTTQISKREVMLTFPYANMPYTSTMRFSSSPWTEWHAFATIPSISSSCEASIIVSAAGDWTKSIIAHPPASLWIRHPPTLNFLTFTPLFKSVLLVATGAGIGPMLSLLSLPAIGHMKAQNKTVRVLWCVYEPDAPHWAFVLDAIRRVDPCPTILSSKERRPDIAFEARYLAEREGLEAVMCVSNKKVTDEVVRGVKGTGRAAYGAVFDS